MSEDITAETREHIAQVQTRMVRAIVALQRRAGSHDASKLEEPEASGFWRMNALSKRSDVKYGSPEYKALMDSERPTIDHHFAHNDHHPEYWKFHKEERVSWHNDQAGGHNVSCMNLLSLLEMMCDWDAAAMRYKDGGFAKSFRMNCDRFGISPQLASIMRNTAVELGFMTREDIAEGY